MGAPLVVALYGRSLILDSVGRQIDRQDRLRVVRVDPGDGIRALAAIAPHVLLIDLDMTPLAAGLDLLGVLSDVLLVGIDASGARLLVLAGPHARTLSTDDLLWLIEHRAEPVFQPA